jgi:iron complex transport system substrate-binding protein
MPICRLFSLSKIVFTGLLIAGGPSALWAQTAALSAVPQRVASLNLCADQLLLALAPERVASLSPFARDPAMSYLAAEAARHPANGGHGETMIIDRPNLALTGPYDGRARRELLAAHGVEAMVLPPWRSLEDGKSAIAKVAARLGASARGDALNAEIDGALVMSRDIARETASGPRTVLPLQTRGYTPGEASLTAELLRHMGLVPYQQTIGLKDGGFVRLEQLVANPPDYLLLSRESAQAFDQGSSLLIHPALARVVPQERRLVVPSPLLTCEGPSTPAAIAALASEVRTKVR